jgi:hypothetical protein
MTLLPCRGGGVVSACDGAFKVVDGRAVDQAARLPRNQLQLALALQWEPGPMGQVQGEHMLSHQGRCPCSALYMVSCFLLHSRHHVPDPAAVRAVRGGTVRSCNKAVVVCPALFMWPVGSTFRVVPG